jgi:dihydrofolate reductase
MATVYFTASSLDGFIAGPGHSLDWLLSRDHDPQGPDSHARFMEEVGALVMGANTCRWLLDHLDGPWPYDIPAWVMTHRPFDPPSGRVRFSAATVPQVHAEAVAAAAGRHVWLVGGGDLVGQFHDAGLLDELHVQFAPATLGAGAPLLPRRIDMDLVSLARNRDFACARYVVRR